MKKRIKSNNTLAGFGNELFSINPISTNNGGIMNRPNSAPTAVGRNGTSTPTGGGCDTTRSVEKWDDNGCYIETIFWTVE